MAKIGAQRAADLTGRSKSTIQRAMKTGKLSYEVDNNGRRVIDTAELDRAFGLMPQEAERRTTEAVESKIEEASRLLEMERMKMRIRALEESLDVAQDQIDDLKDQRDQWQKQAQQVLITSQYSQKQAEELKAELQERERRAKIRKEQEMQRRAAMQGKANENRQQGAISKMKQESTKGFDFQGLWHKMRGASATAVATSVVTTAEAQAQELVDSTQNIVSEQQAATG
jgi:chromosome segregation ATPase